ncbi:MAG: thioredoxin family protein [Planctomycetota bacterium]
MRNVALIRLFAGAALVVGSHAFAQEAPRPLSIQPATPAEQPGTVKAAKKAVYDESADGKKQIEAALAKAKKNNRRVLIQWGANWCGWCIKLHGLYASNQPIAKELKDEYDVVFVDVGQFDKHMDIAMGYGADLKKNGLPFLTILDADGKALVNQETEALEKKGTDTEAATGHDPAKVMGFLKKHQAAYPEAKTVLDAALAKAKTEKKQVFLHFGAPWCGWCHKMEDWMAQPEVAKLLEKEFVDCKLDEDRMKGTKEIEKQFGKRDGGIPWFCFLSADGTKGVDSDAAKGNIGFPAEPFEIEHFKTMLTKSCKTLTKDEIETICATLGKK